LPFYCDRIKFVQIDTISDVWTNLLQLILLPIDWIFQTIDKHPNMRHFFEVTCDTGNSGFWIFISIMIYFFAFLVLAYFLE